MARYKPSHLLPAWKSDSLTSYKFKIATISDWVASWECMQIIIDYSQEKKTCFHCWKLDFLVCFWVWFWIFFVCFVLRAFVGAFFVFFSGLVFFERKKKILS